MAGFAAATLLPVPLLALGAAYGGPWLWAALIYMGGLTMLIDQILPLVEGDAPEGAEFPAADSLLAALGLLAALILPLATWGATAGHLSAGETLALMLTAGFWLGQVAHPTAHELIHRADRRLFRLGVAVYSALLIGHHTSSHRLVHHRHVATRDDPATARAGEGFWRYLRRASVGGFRKGLRAEADLRARGTAPGLHPYATYLGLAALALLLAFLIGGGWGVLVWLALAAHAQTQIHLADYVQHYGLTRHTLPDGRLEPVAMRHSWNTAHWFSSALLLNAPRHSDHHAHPARPYPALRLPEDAPRLPWPLPLACTLALVPPLWRRLMRPHLARWQDEPLGASRAPSQAPSPGVTAP